MEKAPGRLAEGPRIGRMSYLEYKIAKAALVLLAALVWGIYCGFTGRPLSPERSDKSEPPERSKERR